METENTLNIVIIGKRCYKPLFPNFSQATLDPTNISIPADTITLFGPPFYLMHNGWFKNQESITDKTKVDLLEIETKREALKDFIEKLQELCSERGADYVLLLEEFNICKAVSSWSIKGTFQFLLKISEIRRKY